MLADEERLGWRNRFGFGSEIVAVRMQVPLHTIIEIQMGVAGMQEKRYKLMETST